VNIDTDLAAMQLGFGRHELEIGVAVAVRRIPATRHRQLLIKNIITDKIIEQVQGCFYILGRIYKSDIFLEAELGFEIGVAKLKDIRTGVYAVGGDLGDIRGTESPGYIRLHRELIGEIIGSTQAAGDTVEGLTIIRKYPGGPRRIRSRNRHIETGDGVGRRIERRIPERAGIEPEASGYIQFVKTAFGQQEGTYVELVIRRNDEFRPIGSLIVLVHAVDAQRYIPVVKFREEIFYIIVISALLKIETGDSVEDRVTEFSSDTVLVTQVYLQTTVTSQDKTITRIDPVMLYMLM